MGGCFVYGCGHHTGRASCHLFRFPVHERKRNAWVLFCRRADRGYRPSDRICSCHFVDGVKENGPTRFSSSTEPCVNIDIRRRRQMKSTNADGQSAVIKCTELLHNVNDEKQSQQSANETGKNAMIQNDVHMSYVTKQSQVKSTRLTNSRTVDCAENVVNERAKCVVVGCKTTLDEQTKQHGITLHCFPWLKPEMVMLWESIIRQHNPHFRASRSSRVCSLHFTESSFDRVGNTARLLQGAIPILRHYPQYINMRCFMVNNSATLNIVSDPAPIIIEPQTDVQRPEVQLQRLLPPTNNRSFRPFGTVCYRQKYSEPDQVVHPNVVAQRRLQDKLTYESPFQIALVKDEFAEPTTFVSSSQTSERNISVDHNYCQQSVKHPPETEYNHSSSCISSYLEILPDVQQKVAVDKEHKIARSPGIGSSCSEMLKENSTGPP